MINDIFYLCSVAFIINNIYFISNKTLIQTTFDKKDLASKAQLSYYFLSVVYWLWIFIGLFSSLYMWFYVLIIISILKFPLYHISLSTYKLYDWARPYLVIITLSTLLKFYYN